MCAQELNGLRPAVDVQAAPHASLPQLAFTLCVANSSEVAFDFVSV
jgi:hypothetical protein